MTNIAHALKAEISRVARKELRGELQSIKKAVASHRTQIAELKRQVKRLQQDLKSARRASKQSASTAPSSDDSPNIRFSAKGLASQRKRLGLSVAATARILDVSPQSVTNWENGAARPRVSQMAAIASLRKMGKREVAARLGAAQE